MIDVFNEVNESLLASYSFVTVAGLYTCLYCDARFEEDLVYKEGDKLHWADKAAAYHVETAHGGPFKALMARGPSAASLPPVQAKVLELLY